MTTARAIVATGPGGIEVLELVEVDVPAPAPGEVSIAVWAAGVNPVDYKRLGAATAGARVGQEVAGVVTAVGEGVSGVAVGDEVVAYPVAGGYASELTVAETSVFPKPEDLSWEQVANLMLVGVTASHLLAATAVGAGDVVLVHGASGGVGLTALQLAIQRGATVIGTASASNQQLVAKYGGIPVVYGEGLADRVRAAAPTPVTAALDTVGTDEAIDTSIELIEDRQRIATIAGFAHGAEVGIRMLGGGPGADPGRDIRMAARADLVALASEGKLDVVIGATFPLADAVEALTLVATGHPGGQVALIPEKS